MSHRESVVCRAVSGCHVLFFGLFAYLLLVSRKKKKTFTLTIIHQPSIFQTLGLSNDDPLELPVVYDFFCGAGGFSEGARQAGCKVVWACDNDKNSLDTHTLNHPTTEHILCELPLPREEWPFPTDGSRFHAHFSPPCQAFSTINSTHRSDGDRDGATALVKWSVDTALACGATTWSLEQVPSSVVIKVLEDAKTRHPSRVAYAKVQFSLLGVPQMRKRVIAGTPHLVAYLLRCCDRSKQRPVTSVIPKPRGDFIRNSANWVSAKRNGVGGRIRYEKARVTDNCHRVSKPSPTILAHRELSWITVKGEEWWQCWMRPREMALLQTFPKSYKWPKGTKRGMRQVGNSVPPLVAKLIMKATTKRVP